MKKKIGFTLTLATLSLAAVAHADCALETAMEEQVADTALSTDEQAFAAKLNDQNRRAFCSKCSSEQRKAIMVAFANGSEANEAVRGMLAAKERNEAGAVAVQD